MFRGKQTGLLPADQGLSHKAKARTNGTWDGSAGSQAITKNRNKKDV